MNERMEADLLNTIFTDCRRCGTCCRSYRRVLLQPDEVEFIRRMGGHVGVEVSLRDLRVHSMEELAREAGKSGRVYMIHPDGNGCVFLEKHNGRYHCRIYHHRPRACRGFRCNLADASLQDLFCRDATFLLGLDRFGRPLD